MKMRRNKSKVYAAMKADWYRRRMTNLVGRGHWHQFSAAALSTAETVRVLSDVSSQFQEWTKKIADVFIRDFNPALLDSHKS